MFSSFSHQSDNEESGVPRSRNIGYVLPVHVHALSTTDATRERDMGDLLLQPLLDGRLDPCHAIRRVFALACRYQVCHRSHEKREQEDVQDAPTMKFSCALPLLRAAAIACSTWSSASRTCSPCRSISLSARPWLFSAQPLVRVTEQRVHHDPRRDTHRKTPIWPPSRCSAPRCAGSACGGYTFSARGRVAPRGPCTARVADGWTWVDASVCLRGARDGRPG